jgi:hypothetical protein
MPRADKNARAAENEFKKWSREQLKVRTEGLNPYHSEESPLKTAREKYPFHLLFFLLKVLTEMVV